MRSGGEGRGEREKGRGGDKEGPTNYGKPERQPAGPLNKPGKNPLVSLHMAKCGYSDHPSFIHWRSTRKTENMSLPRGFITSSYVAMLRMVNVQSTIHTGKLP